ncbi:MAG: hypothetical protein IJP28_04845, partial [Erysipelotrichales bacterium]|nr:hypothetical protein [Erysipelotrichales bacterium]
NGIADLGQGFMFGHEPAHAVDYFSWTNIKGGLASLAIGAIVYIFIIRICLMDKDENGNRVYVDIWPDWIDLEDAIYRPLLMDVLPAIGAFFARIGDVLVDLVFFLGGQTVTTQEAVPHTFKEFAFMKEKTKASSIQRQISTSLSFSLLLFCIGLVCSLVYLLFVVL